MQTMQNLINFFKKNIYLVLTILICTPTIYRMLQPGIYSMQDFHLFRLFEFDKCIQNFQFPCRWSPDSGLGYGEPLFNFYGQATYWVGEVFHKMGLSFIDSIKSIFIISLIGSGISMFFLSKKIWKTNYSALISSIVYVYAPYRAVDVWVRGALPEAFGFLVFPLIILAIEERRTIWFGVLLSLLILTHNLSLILFLPFILTWIFYRKFWKSIYGFLLAFGLSSFYILPVIFESKFINLENTIHGYFDFRAHFVTIQQLLFSRFWGYGGSTWGPTDGLSLSVGQFQWILPCIVFIYIIIKKKINTNKEFLIFFVLGWFYLLLTHNKSTFIWNILPFMAYIQFPWRFLGVATFSFSLACGLAASIFNKHSLLIAVAIVILVIFFNFSFFKEDIWYRVGDNFFLTGSEWNRQRTASIGDFWPNFGHKIPDTPSDGKFINYFPGWIPNNYIDGLIPSNGSVFKDTPVRKLGNWLSMMTVVILMIFKIKEKWRKTN